MSRRGRLFASATMLLLYGLATTAMARGQITAGDTVYPLHGTLTDGITGKPIGRAVVQSADGRLATWTDADGHFAIKVSVPPRSAQTPGSFGGFRGERFAQPIYLIARKPGYLPQNQPRPLLLDDKLSSTDVPLRLMPSAEIAGRVSATGTDSAANVQVMLTMRQPDAEGRLPWMPVGATNTNARGEFRFGNLRPGEYVLQTATWRGEEAIEAQPNTPVQRYAPVYSGDQPSLASAQKLEVHAGDMVRTELHLHPALYYPVTIPVPAQNANTYISVQELETDTMARPPLEYNRGKEVVEGLLPDGQYTFLFLRNGGAAPAFGLAALSVAGAPVRAAAVTLAPGASIAVRVHAEFTRLESDHLPRNNLVQRSAANSQSKAVVPLLQIYLQSEGAGGNQSASSGQPDATGQLRLENVPPGRYFVHVQPFHGYAAAVTSGGVDLLREPLVVSSSATGGTVDVTLRDDTGSLSGSITAAPAQSPESESSVQLIPMDGAAQFAWIALPADQRFNLGALAPGTYRVLAVHGASRHIAFRDPETMRRYEGKGTVITVAPGQQVHLDIAHIEDGEGAED